MQTPGAAVPQPRFDAPWLPALDKCSYEERHQLRSDELMEEGFLRPPDRAQTGQFT